MGLGDVPPGQGAGSLNVERAFDLRSGVLEGQLGFVFEGGREGRGECAGGKGRSGILRLFNVKQNRVLLTEAGGGGPDEGGGWNDEVELAVDD